MISETVGFAFYKLVTIKVKGDDFASLNLRSRTRAK